MKEYAKENIIKTYYTIAILDACGDVYVKVIVDLECAHLWDVSERRMSSHPRDILDLTSEFSFDPHSSLSPVLSS